MCQIIKVNRRGLYTRQQLPQEQSTKNSWSDEWPSNLFALHFFYSLRPVLCLLACLDHIVQEHVILPHLFINEGLTLWQTGVRQSEDTLNAQPIKACGTSQWTCHPHDLCKHKACGFLSLTSVHERPLRSLCAGFRSETGSLTCQLKIMWNNNYTTTTI